MVVKDVFFKLQLLPRNKERTRKKESWSDGLMDNVSREKQQ